jgi:hypothetical protein
VREVAVGERQHLDVAAEVRRELRGERREEVVLGHAPALELVQRVRAVARGDLAQRATEGALVEPVLLLEGGERLHQRRREHAAEVADDRLDRGHEPSARSSTS